MQLSREDKNAKQRAYHAEWVKRPGVRERLRAQQRVRSKTDIGREEKKRYRESPGGMAVHQRARRKYHGYPEPLYAAPGFCELCGSHKVPKKGWQLDHDHPTGEFRGWLCMKCNTGLGIFGDNIEGLQKAIDYLKRTLRGQFG